MEVKLAIETEGAGLVTAGSQAGNTAALKSLVEKTYPCSCCTLEDVASRPALAPRVLVITSSLEDASPAQLSFLENHVRHSKGTLFLLGEAGRHSSPEFSSFLGARVAGRDPVQEHQVRVYPHFLTWGLRDQISAEFGLYRLEKPEGLKACDAVFYEIDKSRHPVGFERVFEGGGRVVYLGLGSEERDFMSPLLKTVLTNLQQFKRPEDSAVTQGLRAVEFKLDRFRSNYLTENPSEVNSWLQLVNAANSSNIYAHSAIFLPLTPEVYADKIRRWHAAVKDGTDLSAALRRSLTSIEIRATDYCDEDCYFCFNRRSRPSDHTRKAIAPEDHLRLEDSLLAHRGEGNLFAVRYTGAGEPLCHPRTLPSIYRFAEAHIPTCLITNGRALKSEDCDRLGERATMLRFSINAGSPESYEKIHRVPGAVFPRLLENIQRIHEAKIAHHRENELLIGATFLVCPDNHTEIVRFCEQLRSAGANAVWIRGCDDMAGLSKAQIGGVEEQLGAAHALAAPGFSVFSRQFEVLKEYFCLHYRYDDTTCWSALTKTFVQPDGEVRVCLSRNDLVLGQISKQNFFDIWSGQIHADFVAKQGWHCFGPCIERRFNNVLDFLNQNLEGDLGRGQLIC